MTACKNCRHWEADRDSYGVCRKISDAGDWQNRDPAVIVAWAADDTGLGSKLLTSPDFGCTSFQNAADYQACAFCRLVVHKDDLCWSTKDGAIGLCRECRAAENPDA